MKKQKTAIDWLIKQITNNGFIKFATNEQIKQAKEMEKEEIMNAWVNGVISEGDITAEKYYKKTFKK